MVSVSVDAMADGNGLVKLSDRAWELNVVASLADLRKLRGVEETDWEGRRTLKVGTCLDAPVWWNEKDGNVYILVGTDDEVWDVCVIIPVSVVSEILVLAEDELGKLPDSARMPAGQGCRLHGAHAQRLVHAAHALPSRVPAADTVAVHRRVGDAERVDLDGPVSGHAVTGLGHPHTRDLSTSNSAPGEDGS